MADTIREVPYYYITSADKPGQGAALLETFREAGVKFLAVHAFPERRRAQVDLVPEDAQAFTNAARRAKIKLSPRKRAFLIEGRDRTGALVPALEALAEAGVNVTAITALTAGRSRFGAILWVKPKDQRKAAKALGV